MSAQEITLHQYHQWMQINATSHLIRTARKIGILSELRDGQRTLQQLCQAQSLKSEPTILLLDALVAIGIVEKYGNDYALARAAHLLCQYDDDLGDQRWLRLADAAQGTISRLDNDHQLRLDHVAATQWIHTPAAIQAAEILDIGGADQPQGISILDLGCGSAVWSCAMAHRDPQATVTAVDHPDALKAAQRTAESIELHDRFQTVAFPWDLHDRSGTRFDLVLLAQRLSSFSDLEASDLLLQAAGACQPGGRVVVIDFFRGPGKPTLVDGIEALTLQLETSGGRIRSLEETHRMLTEAGLQRVQFTFLAASEVNLGMAVANKPIA